jgi:hypothetical protein
MMARFAALITPVCSETRSNGYVLSEEQVSGSENLPAPGQADGEVVTVKVRFIMKCEDSINFFILPSQPSAALMNIRAQGIISP